MNRDQLLKIVEQYNRKVDDNYGDIKVIQIADQKTVFVEQINGNGQMIMLEKCMLSGATYWAGYSMRSNTVYISKAA